MTDYQPRGNGALYVAFSNGVLDPDMKQALVLGPFDPDYVELTYGTLRVNQGDDFIADFSVADGYWHIITGTAAINERETIRQCGQWHAPSLGDTQYSDIDIYWRNE